MNLEVRYPLRSREREMEVHILPNNPRVVEVKKLGTIPTDEAPVSTSVDKTDFWKIHGNHTQ